MKRKERPKRQESVPVFGFLTKKKKKKDKKKKIGRKKFTMKWG